MDPQTPPEPVERPKLARYLWERRLSAAVVAPIFGCSPETVRRYCLEFGHADRMVPGQTILKRIVQYTEGEVSAADFYPAHLNGGDPAVLALARAE